MDKHLVVCVPRCPFSSPHFFTYMVRFLRRILSSIAQSVKFHWKLICKTMVLPGCRVRRIRWFPDWRPLKGVQFAGRTNRPSLTCPDSPLLTHSSSWMRYSCSVQFMWCMTLAIYLTFCEASSGLKRNTHSGASCRVWEEFLSGF